MVIKKILSTNLGTHYPEQALLLTEKGEVYVTSDTLEPGNGGYVLVRFFDLTLLDSRINGLLQGVQGNGLAELTPNNQTVAVSAIANLYRLTGYTGGEQLTQINGGYAGQTITLIGNGTPITITTGGNLQLASDFATTDAFSALVLHRAETGWIELSRSMNN